MDFIPAPSFVGPKPDMIFKTGEKGLGYYPDGFALGNYEISAPETLAINRELGIGNGRARSRSRSPGSDGRGRGRSGSPGGDRSPGRGRRNSRDMDDDDRMGERDRYEDAAPEKVVYNRFPNDGTYLARMEAYLAHQRMADLQAKGEI